VTHCAGTQSTGALFGILAVVSFLVIAPVYSAFRLGRQLPRTTKRA
jgi:hypothetical protein